MILMNITCIKPNADLSYFKSLECEWLRYKSPSNVRIINTTASCHKYECLTWYGWIYLHSIGLDLLTGNLLL